MAARGTIDDRAAEPGGGGAPGAESGRPLPPALLYRTCDPAGLPFELVGELDDLLEPIGQDRAVEAVQFAVTMRRKGYGVRDITCMRLAPAGPASTQSSKIC